MYVLLVIVIVACILLFYHCRHEGFYEFSRNADGTNNRRQFNYNVDDDYTGNSYFTLASGGGTSILAYIKPYDGGPFYALGAVSTAPVTLANGTLSYDTLWMIRKAFFPNVFLLAQGVDASALRAAAPTPYQPVMTSAALGNYRFADRSIVTYGGLYYIVLWTQPDRQEIRGVSAATYSRLRGRASTYALTLTLSELNSLRSASTLDPSLSFWEMGKAYIETSFRRTTGRTFPLPSDTVYTPWSMQRGENQCVLTAQGRDVLGYLYDPVAKTCQLKVGDRVIGTSVGIRRPDGTWKIYMNMDLAGNDSASGAAASHAECQSLTTAQGGDFYTFNGSVCRVKRLPVDSTGQRVVGLNVDSAPKSLQLGVLPVEMNTLPYNRCYTAGSPAVYYVNSGRSVCEVAPAEVATRCPNGTTARTATEVLGGVAPAIVPKCSSVDTLARSSRWYTRDSTGAVTGNAYY